MINYKHCPQCKHQLIKKSGYPYCKKCDITIYQNPKPTACIFLVNNNKILVNKRAIEPYKDAFDIPGGFLELGEHPEEAVIREVKEETGLDITIRDLVSVQKDRYGKGEDYLVNFYYVGQVTGGEMKAADDVKDLEWVPIENIPKMGFPSANEAVKDFRKWFKRNS